MAAGRVRAIALFLVMFIVVSADYKMSGVVMVNGLQCCHDNPIGKEIPQCNLSSQQDNQACKDKCTNNNCNNGGFCKIVNHRHHCHCGC